VLVTGVFHPVPDCMVPTSAKTTVTAEDSLSPDGFIVGGEGWGEGAPVLSRKPKPPHPALSPGCTEGEGSSIHPDLVATTGGTAAARNAGPSTASWPRPHNASAPIGR